MEKVIFTLCSNNYLAHAYAFGHSVKELTPDLRIVIGLVDRKDPAIDYSRFPDFEILSYDSLGVSWFEEMLGRYNVIEFNTAVKPFYIDYFFRQAGGDCSVLYIDPDILFYQSPDILFELLQNHSILVTPNLTEVGKAIASGELASLRHGMFNLGFIGVRDTPESRRFLEWWMHRLHTHCKIDKGRGVFVDQKWVDLAPLYFKGFHVVFYKGYNMAWWNVSERKLLKRDGVYFVNDYSTPLVFFHFSGYKPGSVFFTGRNNDAPENSFDAHPELKALFEDYVARLYANGFETYSKVKPLLPFGFAIPSPKKGYASLIKKGLKRLLKG